MSQRQRIPVHQEPAHATTLYARREPIQVRHVRGIYQKLRDAGMGISIFVYMILPWVQFDGRQAMLFDLPQRRFDIFMFSFWPQDFMFLAWALILSALALFFVTVFAGRVYCGYFCPQTNWTRLFFTIERWCEGDRLQRQNLAAAPWSLNKLTRRLVKHSGWLIVSLATGLTFVGYFTPIRELIPDFFTGQIGGWAWFWIGFFTLATYGNAGFMREQVCLYMCPYARFQSVMFDANTLIVSYDEERGEPRRRGLRKAANSNQSAGDCIDCNLCVQVCPTGIDIREGLQVGCITCAACIDACDEVMTRIDRPKGLIRYTTENALAGHFQKLLRPRLLGYGGVLAALTLLFAAQLYQRVPLQVDVLRDRHELYRQTSDGFIENSYRLQLLNKSQVTQHYRLTLEGPDVLTLVAGPQTFPLASGEHRSVPVTVRYDPYEEPPANSRIWFRVQSLDDPRQESRHESRFIFPD